MKISANSYKTFKLLCLFLLVAAWALMAVAQPNLNWGAITNGLQLGISQGGPFCVMYIRNTDAIQGTNYRGVFIMCAPPERRYMVKLLDPQGKPVDLIPKKLTSINQMFTHGGTIITNTVEEFASFSVIDVFKVQTNGLHTLIFSEFVTTNKTKPRLPPSLSASFEASKSPTYFLLPPVTNTFNILTNDITADSQG